MTLADKIAASRAILAETLDRYGPEHTAVAFTGGKDSSVALHLYRSTLVQRGESVRPLALSLDTGRKFPEVTTFRDQLAALWDVDLRVIHPSPSAIAAADPADKAGCCTRLKIEPLRRAIAELGIQALVTGIRADEHESRAGRPVYERRTGPDYVSVNALIDWTLLDVWSYIADAGLPYCELYDLGYSSLGCQPCTVAGGDEAGERAGRDPDKEALLPALHSLGYF